MIGATQPGALTKQQARLGRTIVLAATGAGKTTTVLSSIFNEELGYYEHYAMIIIISPDCDESKPWHTRNKTIRRLSAVLDVRSKLRAQPYPAQS